MKVVRTITYEGTDEWVVATLSKSLKDGQHVFRPPGCRITVETEKPNPEGIK